MEVGPTLGWPTNGISFTAAFRGGTVKPGLPSS